MFPLVRSTRDLNQEKSCTVIALTSMGCKPSKRKVGVWFNNMSVLDETVSFQSKIEAIKFILKSSVSRHAFQQYLERKGSAIEYLRGYSNLERAKKDSNDNIASEITLTLRQFREMGDADDELSQSAIDIMHVGFHGQPPSVALDLSEKLTTLQNLDLSNMTRNALQSAVVAAQELLLGELAVHFEGFLKSTYYKEWVDMQLQIEKQSGKYSTVQHPRSHAAVRVGSGIQFDHSEISGKRKASSTLIAADIQHFGNNDSIFPS